MGLDDATFRIIIQEIILVCFYFQCCFWLHKRLRTSKGPMAERNKKIKKIYQIIIHKIATCRRMEQKLERKMYFCSSSIEYLNDWIHHVASENRCDKSLRPTAIAKRMKSNSFICAEFVILIQMENRKPLRNIP